MMTFNWIFLGFLYLHEITYKFKNPSKIPLERCLTLYTLTKCLYDLDRKSLRKLPMTCTLLCIVLWRIFSFIQRWVHIQYLQCTQWKIDRWQRKEL